MNNSRNIDISVISIVYNDPPGIKRALESVLSQKNVNYEIIVVDGASSDGTAEIACAVLSDYKQSLVISEKDMGIYDAINKGIRRASGIYILMLNAGDYLHDELALSYLFTQAEKSNSSYALGRCIYYYPDKKLFVPDKPDMPGSGAPEICHQAFLYKRSLHNDLGYYDDRMKSAADYAFFCKLKFSGKMDFVKKDRFVVVRGKSRNDASEKLRNVLEMTTIDIRTGLIWKTWRRRFKSIASRSVRGIVNIVFRRFSYLFPE